MRSTSARAASAPGAASTVTGISPIDRNTRGGFVSGAVVCISMLEQLRKSFALHRCQERLQCLDLRLCKRPGALQPNLRRKDRKALPQRFDGMSERLKPRIAP